jgi:hypothetical protein
MQCFLLSEKASQAHIALRVEATRPGYGYSQHKRKLIPIWLGGRVYIASFGSLNDYFFSWRIIGISSPIVIDSPPSNDKTTLTKDRTSYGRHRSFRMVARSFNMADSDKVNSSPEGSERATKHPSDTSRFLDRLLWSPKWLRWEPEANHELTWSLNILYGVVSDSHDVPLAEIGRL